MADRYRDGRSNRGGITRRPVAAPRRCPAPGAAGATAIATDFRPARCLRRFLPKRDTFNVVSELGDPKRERTVVFVSHHDAANAGTVFHPGIPDLVSKTGAFQHLDTSPMLMAPVIGGPAARRDRRSDRGAEAGSGGPCFRRIDRLMVDIGLRKVVPGDNDNGTAVIACLELARRFRADPSEGLRLILLSAGS